MDGFGLVTRRLDCNRRTKEIYRVTLVCNRSTTYKARPEEDQRQRNTSTGGCACPFKINITKFQDTDYWQGFIVHAEHNHDKARKATGHAVHRRADMTEEMLTLIENASAALQTPKQIWINIRKMYRRSGITLQDVYNAKKKIRLRKLGRYTPTQAILRALKRESWFVRFELDQKTKRVKRLFFVNKNIAEVLSKNPEVLIMDCTYKTNKYRMPLFVVMGATSLGTSFYIALAFIDGEEEPDFDWIIVQIKELYRELGLKDPIVLVTDRDLALMNVIAIHYPAAENVLCIWHINRNVLKNCHINRNVLKNCKPEFETQEEWNEFLTAWHAVVYATTPAEYEEAWQSLKTEYENEHEDEVEYLQAAWLDEHKEHFCKAWTNEITHFNTLTTSRVEGGHRVLKSVLKFSTGDLMTVVDRLETLLEGQYDDYTTKLEQAKMSTAFNLPRELMSDLLGKVSPYALQKIRKQWKKVRRANLDPESEAFEELGPCTRSFATTMGLPCAHMIEACMKTPEARLSLDDVHPHWRFKKPESLYVAPANNLTSDDALRSRQLLTDFSDLSDLPDADEFLHEVHAGPSSHMKPRSPSPPSEDEAANYSINHMERRSLSPLSERETDDHTIDRMKPRSPSPPSEDEGLSDVLDIKEPEKAKGKGRPKGSQNKKGTMTKAEKKAANSTKRDPSGFELVERDIASRAKRAKKEAAGKSKEKINKKNTSVQSAQGRGARGGRGSRGGAGRARGARGGAAKRATRSAAIVSQVIAISSDESSDDGFRNLALSSDEDFDVLEQGDEDTRDDWIN